MARAQTGFADQSVLLARPGGTPRAYVRYKFKEIALWERRLEAQVVALDAAAWQAVLGFLRNHDSQAQEIRLNLPEDSRLLAVLGRSTL